MAIYLNTNKSFENYRELVNEEYFVDKSSMIASINKKISTKNKYICVTRPRRFGEYFGFTEDEVKKLCDKNRKMQFRELEAWYNGYLTSKGIKIYNPRSVVKSLQNNYCESYWTNTGAMDEVAEYLKYNTLEIRDDVIEMVSGEEIDIIIDEDFRAGQGAPRTKEEIYAAMIVLGFLSYHDGYLKIPNKELMKEFERALRDKAFGYVSDIIESSN